MCSITCILTNKKLAVDKHWGIGRCKVKGERRSNKLGRIPKACNGPQETTCNEQFPKTQDSKLQGCVFGLTRGHPFCKS